MQERKLNAEHFDSEEEKDNNRCKRTAQQEINRKERRNAVRFRANQKKTAMAPETDGNGREDTGTIH